ncbi:leucine-rich repeat protein [Eubacterium sp. AF15-50]|uniref:leucine-rich repeat protein n=1 Tax=Eubacterium sp. AF15-50 TaxID=2293103 RepID=UPI002672E385|nr:leucine-rich repeat protein [Eubacterium sp. AF15-50]
MRKEFKKIVTWGMVVAMAFSPAPSVFTTDANTVYADSATSGSCGSEAQWSYDSASETLTISGKGAVSSSPFSEIAFKKLIIEEGITQINSRRFLGSSALESVSLPKTITNLGEYAFENCQSLKEILVDDENENFKSTDGVLYTKNMQTLLIYPANRENTDFSIPETVRSFGDYAFDYSQNLENITIPAGLRSMGEYEPFYCAKSIKNFDVATGNGYYASKDGCLYSKDLKKLIKYTIAGEDKSVTIDGSTIINDNAFYNSANLEEVVLKNSVSEIGYMAFYNCDKLSKLTIENSECKINDILNNSNVTICGYAASTADTYAKRNDLQFSELSEKKVSSIEISEYPKKTVFAIGDKFNCVGLEIKVNYVDGTSAIKSSGFSVKGFASDKVERRTLTVEYGGKTTTYDIVVVTQLNIQDLTTRKNTTVNIVEKNQTSRLRFIPAKSGDYNIYSIGDDTDTWAALYDVDENLLLENDDRGELSDGNYDSNFFISYHLEANKVYFLDTKFEDKNAIGSFDVAVKLIKEDETEAPTTEPTTEAPTAEPTTELGSEHVTSQPATEPGSEPTAVAPTQKPTTVAPTQPETTTKTSGGGNITTKKQQTTTVGKVTVKKTKVSKFSKKLASNKVKISLKKIKGISGYEIKISSSKKYAKSKTVTKKVKKNVFTVKSSKIKNKKVLYVKVRCYKKVGKKVYYSRWTSKKVKIKK